MKHRCDTMIKPTANERSIFTLLLQASCKFSSHVTLRVAGGWVRDKLLNTESHDIDIVLDTLTGYAFACQLNSYLSSNTSVEGTTDKSTSSSPHTNQPSAINIHKIESNPLKSKHLETATVKLYGQFIDFVNLRSEVYQEDSRIPSMVFGSPLEDALRRDLTINSLFYNLHTCQVEDFTNKGLDDLKNKIIRTPMEPTGTFIDDPLRVLRVIRFASRLQYSIVPEIFTAVLDPEIKKGFSEKISKERVGTEVEKMFSGPDPVRSISLIRSFGFFDVVFEPHSSIQINQDASLIALKTARALHCKGYFHIRSFHQSSKMYYSYNFNSNFKIMYLACTCSSYASLTLPSLKNITVGKYIMQISLKLSTVVSDQSSALTTLSSYITETLKTLPRTRKSVGMFIRKISEKPIHEKWHLVLLYACSNELSAFIGAQECESRSGMPHVHTKTTFTDQDSVDKILKKYVDFFTFIETYQLENVHTLKPLIDGKMVSHVLGIKPGPGMMGMMDKVVEWQIEHPGESVGECVKYVEQNKEKWLQQMNVKLNDSKKLKLSKE